MPVIMQSSGTRMHSSNRRARFGCTTSSDDDSESTISAPKENGKMSSQMNFKDEDDDQLTKEADDEIVNRYLTRYTSMNEAAGKAPSHSDGDPGSFRP